MEFEWDEHKNQLNRAKHGIRFETAVRAFSDGAAVLEQDRHVDGEERWQLTGLVDAFHLIVVAHTYRDETNGLEKNPYHIGKTGRTTRSQTL